MKNVFVLAILTCLAFSATTLHAQQQDKSKRPSPPAKVTQKIKSGATISIDYSRPSLKGRTIGKDVEPMSGQVWRMGANEATVFETDKNVEIEGKNLPAGKYSLFGVEENGDYTLIFNNAWNIWGTQYDANKDKDALRVKVKPQVSKTSQEMLTYAISKKGIVTMNWGTMQVAFKVK